MAGGERAEPLSKGQVLLYICAVCTKPVGGQKKTTLGEKKKHFGEDETTRTFARVGAQPEEKLSSGEKYRRKRSS